MALSENHSHLQIILVYVTINGIYTYVRTRKNRGKGTKNEPIDAVATRY